MPLVFKSNMTRLIYLLNFFYLSSSAFGGGTDKPTSQYDFDFVGYERRRAKSHSKWQGRYTETSILPSDVPTSPTEYQQVHGALQANEKPLVLQGEVYFKGNNHKKGVGMLPPHSHGVAFVGPRHMNYIQRNDDIDPSYEVFGVPQPTAPEIDKGAYSRSHQPKFVEVYSLSQKKMIKDSTIDKGTLSPHEIIFDPGHGIDHAITITDKGSNSTADVRNYTPQNAYYNRWIRNCLVDRATNKGFSYKEIAIYGENPLPITRQKGRQEVKQPIPEGFVFSMINRTKGTIEKSYYFPNFHEYLQEANLLPSHIKPLKYFRKKYEISSQLTTEIWGIDEISGQQSRENAQRVSEHIGYRALSGRYEVLPDNGVWELSSRNALIRTAAIYRMQRAAEFDPSVENMLAVAQTFNDNFKYYEFNGTLKIPHLAKYWVDRALEEVKRKNYPAQDVFFFMEYEEGISIEPRIMSSLISSFEEKLRRAPNAEHVIKLLEYFNDKKNEEKYKEWSHYLSEHIAANNPKKSAVITEKNVNDLTNILSDTNIINIILDVEITPSILEKMFAGFKYRVINEQSQHERNLNFIEMKNISKESLLQLLIYLDYGVVDKDRRLYVNLYGTMLKLPEYSRQAVQSYVKKHFPKTHVKIAN